MHVKEPVVHVKSLMDYGHSKNNSACTKSVTSLQNVEMDTIQKKKKTFGSVIVVMI